LVIGADEGVWSRESDPGTGANEHLHLLTHIPSKLVRRFRETASGWFAKAAEIDIRRADYRTRWTASGKQRSAIGYLTKNSPQAAYGRPREYRKGGPIFGKRAGCSRNIDVSARAIWEARRAIQREFGIPTTHDHHGVWTHRHSETCLRPSKRANSEKSSPCRGRLAPQGFDATGIHIENLLNQRSAHNFV
jgi:hypothetical protein